MLNEILLNGISFEQLEKSIKTIVANELQHTFAEFLAIEKKETPEYITRKETATLLGVSLPTLHDWTKKGVLPAKKINSRVRYEKQAVLDAMQSVTPLKYRRA